MTEPVKQVAIAIPSGRQWEADMAIKMVSVISRATAAGTPTLTINEKNSMVAMARNSLVAKALQSQATHILWCDADNVPPSDLIKRFLDHDVDIVGGIYCKRVPPYELLGVPFAPVDLTTKELVPFWLLPGGCMMVSAKVYRTLPYPWYFDTIRRDGTPIEHFISLLHDHYHLTPPEHLIRMFQEDGEIAQWLEQEEETNKTKFANGKHMGEDYNFCLKAQRYGFKLWCDMSVSLELGHIGEQVIYFAPPEENKLEMQNLSV